ncbi:MAG: hypothetical protein NW215_10625 [Hyphomicrobiales bacterium]|nr:hypothetical protein [Hyphomicrobiales bacterium]
MDDYDRVARAVAEDKAFALSAENAKLLDELRAMEERLLALEGNRIELLRLDLSFVCSRAGQSAELFGWMESAILRFEEALERDKAAFRERWGRDPK